MDSSTPLTEVRAGLESIFPAFKNWLLHKPTYDNPDAMDGKGFTECGLFLELAPFLRERPEFWQQNAFERLSKILEAIITSPVNNLVGAVDICFLETIGGTKPLADAVRPFPFPRSRYALDLDIPPSDRA